jgi:branched-chain amino acid transport system substrate-binding protein
MLNAFAGRLGPAILGSALVLAPTQTFAQEPIKIGFFGPLTDRFAGLGLDAKKGADLAVKQAKAAGGVGGRGI